MYIGVSSGAMALSYYIANQYKQYFSISSSVFSNVKFLNYKNTFSEQGYMNLSFLEKYVKKNYHKMMIFKR